MDERTFERLLAEDLEWQKSVHRYRRLRVVRAIDATHLEFEGRRYVNFASNDYLGLTHHPRLIAAAREAAAAWGTGSGAAALISGYGEAHRDAEEAIARWKGTESAVLLPSGYQANHAAVQAIAAMSNGLGGDVRFLLDKLVHASLIDAVRATELPRRVFPHNHLPKLRRLLEEADDDQLQVVVTESIFSMDGDAADLAGLGELKRQRPFVLLLDEAHGGGVYGPQGGGYAAEAGLAGIADVTIVTLSKALGGIGGAVCGSNLLCEAVVNHARAFIFSTGVPASVAAVAKEAIAVMTDEPWRQQRVRELAGRTRAELRRAGLSIPDGDSPIVPLVVGDESAALRAAEQLREKGMFVVAVRPPTVPRGSSRIRVTLSSAHTDEEVAALIAALKDLWPSTA